jgi:hypothetical protein
MLTVVPRAGRSWAGYRWDSPPSRSPFCGIAVLWNQTGFAQSTPIFAPAAASVCVGISASTELTRFYNVRQLNVVGQLPRPIVERRRGDFAPVGIRYRHCW